MAEVKKNELVESIAAVLETGIRGALDRVPASLERDFAGAMIDKLQKLVDGTSTPFDDAVLEPIIDRLRATFGIAK